MAQTTAPPPTGRDADPSSGSFVRDLIGRISRLELVVAAVIAAVLLVLVVIEPDILEAPFENSRTLLFTVGGTVLAAVAFVVMLWLRVPPIVRVVVLVVPFAIVNWWLLSPYFIDDVVDEDFSTSIAEQAPLMDDPPADAPAEGPADPVTTVTASTADTATGGETEQTSDDDGSEPGAATDEPATAEEPPPTEPPAPTGPVLLGVGQFVGLAGHEGTGDAGLFRNPDGTFTLRFENFDIENGPDLEVYWVPGADQTSLPAGSIALGELKGNIGDQNYELPAGTELPPGSYTALVWCEAFSVEFVGATITI